MEETLCWRCQRPGTSSCSWDKSLTPVEGWTATETRISLWPEGEKAVSYCVHACPMFRPVRRSGRDSARGLGSVLTEEMLERLVFRGFNDREIAAMTNMAVSTVRRRRLAYLRHQKEEETE